MPRSVGDVDVLTEYISGVIRRADHHAGGVDAIALAVAGGILWRKDPGTDLEVFEREGKMTNVLWVVVGGTRYALSYNHDGAIEIRRGSTHGDVVASFSNSNTAVEVKEFFEGL